MTTAKPTTAKPTTATAPKLSAAQEVAETLDLEAVGAAGLAEADVAAAYAERIAEHLAALEGEPEPSDEVIALDDLDLDLDLEGGDAHPAAWVRLLTTGHLARLDRVEDSADAGGLDQGLHTVAPEVVEALRAHLEARGDDPADWIAPVRGLDPDGDPLPPGPVDPGTDGVWLVVGAASDGCTTFDDLFGSTPAAYWTEAEAREAAETLAAVECWGPDADQPAAAVGVSYVVDRILDEDPADWAGHLHGPAYCRAVEKLLAGDGPLDD